MISNGTKTGRGWTSRPAGALARLASACSLAVAAVLAVAASPAGAFVYTNSSSGAVLQYSGGSSGSLSQLWPPAGGSSAGPGPEALSPDGHSLYVVNNKSDGHPSVSQYSVAANGTLSAKAPAIQVPESAGTESVGTDVSAITVSPGDHYLYVVNVNWIEDADCGAVTSPYGCISDTLYQYAIGSGGVVGSTPIASAGTGDDPTGVAAYPGGGVYVTNSGDGTISQYAAGGSGGLTPLSPATVSTGTGPAGSGSGPQALAIDSSDASVYVANYAGTVYEYSVESSGVLVPKPIPAVSSRDEGYAIAISPNRQYVYVLGENGLFGAPGVVNQFTIGNDGELSAMTPSSVPTGVVDPGGIAISPDGNSVYVGANDGIWQYSVGASGALSPMSAGVFDTSGTPTAIVAGGPETNLAASHSAPLTLTLTAGVSNTPLARQTVTFTAGGQSCTTTTNASGQAGACESNTAALMSGFQVTYAGDPDYQGSSTGTLPLEDLTPPPLLCTGGRPAAKS